MQSYKKVLAAVDLTDEASDVLTAAQNVVAEQEAELHVVTVIQPLTYAYTGFEMPSISQTMVNFESEASASARDALARLCKGLNVAKDHRHIVFGRPADEVKALARELDADLVVIGTHGRRGLGLLLGSTANGVLHGAPCDVLTIRIKE